MARIALGIAYDGSPWRGWQRQPHGQTVQNEVETAASRFLNQATRVSAAGRTDAGVHAISQVAHIDTNVERRPESWIRALNSYLPPQIAVQWACEVSQNFHAQFSAQSRTYVYVVRNARVRSPLSHQHTGWVFQPLQLKPMQQAAKHFLGEHDFSSFRSSDCQASSPTRLIFKADIEQYHNHFYFIFTANGFLHHMVRNMVGALIAVGQEKQQADWIIDLLQKKDRRLSAATFSPNGLYLAEINYPEHFNIPTTPWRQSLASLVGMGLQSG